MCAVVIPENELLHLPRGEGKIGRRHNSFCGENVGVVAVFTDEGVGEGGKGRAHPFD